MLIHGVRQEIRFARLRRVHFLERAAVAVGEDVERDLLPDHDVLRFDGGAQERDPLAPERTRTQGVRPP